MTTLYQRLMLWLEVRRYDRTRITAPCVGCGGMSALIPYCEGC